MTWKTLFVGRDNGAPGATSIGLLVLRLVAGCGFMLHGLPKIKNPFNWMGPDAAIPPFFQSLAAVSEFGGGIAWMLGALTPFFSFGAACTMTVAVWTHAVVRGDPFVGKGASYEPALLFLSIALLLILAGPGRYSIDALIRRRTT